MEVYFVRHGQTDGNVAHRHQHPDTPINEVGVAQARAVAAEVRRLKPTHLITSTHVRAFLTAREIGNACDLIPETYPAFQEFKRPDFLVGERMVGQATLRFVWNWFWGRPDASMHDGESHEDFVKRIGVARRYLEALPPTARVVVVSHSVFINFFLEHMSNPRKMGLIRAAVRFTKILLLPNTSVTHVRFRRLDDSMQCGWELVQRL